MVSSASYSTPTRLTLTPYSCGFAQGFIRDASDSRGLSVRLLALSDTQSAILTVDHPP